MLHERRRVVGDAQAAALGPAAGHGVVAVFADAEFADDLGIAQELLEPSRRKARA